MSHPLARDAAPLDAATLATLKAELARPGMNAEKVRKRLVPVVSGATFHRAMRGLKVSLPVQRACDAMAYALQCGVVSLDPNYDFDPDPEAA